MKQPTLSERVEFARQAAYVKRCHNMRTIETNTVGIHSHNMVSMYLVLHPQPKVEVVKALQFHDYGERGAGDTPAPAKWACPKLKAAYEVLQATVLRNFGLPHDDRDLDHEDISWLKNLDAMDFYLFCQDEIMFGNRHVIPQFRAIQYVLDDSAEKGNMPSLLVSYYHAIRDSRPVFDELEILQ